MDQETALLISCVVFQKFQSTRIYYQKYYLRLINQLLFLKVKNNSKQRCLYGEGNDIRSSIFQSVTDTEASF